MWPYCSLAPGIDEIGMGAEAAHLWLYIPADRDKVLTESSAFLKPSRGF